MNIQTWEDIKGYEGYYQISDIGRVKSLERPVYKKDGTFHRMKRETIKMPKLSSDGYYNITLSVNGVNKTFPIHRLVAEAFIPKPDTDELLEVNHLDYDRLNNRKENLEWTTHLKNVAYSAREGRYSKPFGEDNPNYGNHKLHDYYQEHPEEAVRLLGRPGIQNGHHAEVDLLDLSGNVLGHFKLMTDCAKYIKEMDNPRGSVTSIVQKLSSAWKTNAIVYKKYRIRKTNQYQKR